MNTRTSQNTCIWNWSQPRPSKTWISTRCSSTQPSINSWEGCTWTKSSPPEHPSLNMIKELISRSCWITSWEEPLIPKLNKKNWSFSLMINRLSQWVKLTWEKVKCSNLLWSLRLSRISETGGRESSKNLFYYFHS